MTAVLNAIRRLDELLDRGDISPEEHARRRASLLRNIEDAQAEVIDISPQKPDKQAPAPNGSSAFGLGVVVVFAVMGLCISLTLFFLSDVNLALTLGVTILAALAVTLLRETEE